MNWVSTAERLPLTERGQIRCLAGWWVEIPGPLAHSYFTWVVGVFTKFCEGEGASWIIEDDGEYTIEADNPKAPQYWLLVPGLEVESRA